MRLLAGFVLILCVIPALANEPTAPQAVDQESLTVEQVTTTESVVIDIADKDMALLRRAVPQAEVETSPPVAGPTTERIEFDTPPVNIVNTTRHFRIIALKNPEPAAAETSVPENQE